jgi:polyhydroxybutyrate depolymerase
MTRRTKKVLISALAILIGVPVALIVTAIVWLRTEGKTNGSIVSSGESRNYLLYVPKTYDPAKPTPLLISFHPAASRAEVEMDITQWNQVADAHGFIVVYPSGSHVPRVWPMGPHSLVVDVKFISELIDKLQGAYNIDADRVFADGISNGGGMAFALSCRLGDRIAAISTVAAAQTLPVTECGEGRPVPAVAFHGTADPVVPYQGGSSPVSPTPFPSIEDWTAGVAHRNHCEGDKVETQVTASIRRRAYPGCANNADVVLYTITGGGHTWPGGHSPYPQWIVGSTNREINATNIIWDFFAQHPMARLKAAK